MNQAISQQSIAQAFKLLGSSSRGLSEKEAQKRLVVEGKNVFGASRKGFFQVLVNQLRSPLLVMLLFAAAVSFFLGELIDSITILVIIILNTALGFVQEYRSEKALEKLKNFVSAQVVVIRSGEKKKIGKEDLVKGDLVELVPGDIVPADLRLVETTDLAINESVLTGEAFPKSKNNQTAKKSKNPLEENIAYMGCEVVTGFGLGVVFAKGRDSRMGKIAELTSETSRKSSFVDNTNRFSKFILRSVSITLILVFIANLFLKGPDTNWVNLLLFAIALAVSVIPEALPIVTTITLSQGALALAKRSVVVKRLSALEDLGHIEILCSDKTGTITENKLKVEEIFSDSRQECIQLALAAREEVRVKGHASVNTFDNALEVYLKELGLDETSSKTLKVIPFDPKRKRVLSLVEFLGKKWLVSKGAPEEILKISRLTTVEKKKIKEKYLEFGKAGFRSLALAAKEISKNTLEEKDEELLQFKGLIAYSDPIKKSAKEAIQLAEKLNIRVKILTGDSGYVAGVVAHQLGIVTNPEEFIEGEELSKLSGKDLVEIVEKFDVFARVTPEQKYTIIQALQTKSAVGFLGEGINDAPALKLANVSLVVDHASDVAKEAADVILMRKDLGVIVYGIRAGREIFTNIDKYIKYTLIGNFGNFYAIAAISLISPFLPMLPIQILLSNLLTDLPLISVAADRVDLEEVEKPKKFNIRELAFLALLLGLTSSMFDFIFFAIFRSHPSATVQTLWFVTSILTELVLIFSIRTSRPIWKASLPSFVLVSLVILAGLITFFLPFVSLSQEIFHFVQPNWNQIRIILSLVVGYFIFTEIVKVLYYRSSFRH